MAELLDQLEAMLEQEYNAYGTVNYLAPSFQQQLLSPRQRQQQQQQQQYLEKNGSLDESSSGNNSQSLGADGSSSSSSGISELWREKICEWCYQVIDHFDFSREVVAIAMNYLDRYLATKVVNKKVFQLAAMTALFLAVKLHEPAKLSMASMIELSRGSFTVQQMAAMEISLIRGLSWHLHPPTAHSFTKRFLHLVPLSSIALDVLYDVLELSRFLAELSVIDYFFVTQRPSHVAVAAIANAMQDIASVSFEAQNEFGQLMLSSYGIDILGSTDIMECRNRLRLLCALQGNLANGAMAAAPAPMVDGEGVSPVSVAYGTSQYHQAQQQQLQQVQVGVPAPPVAPAQAFPPVEVAPPKHEEAMNHIDSLRPHMDQPQE
eukprot:CAMPEP_0168720008 /NCGR_PEP_ID=MMETSP0724-20121128/1336_1 /TAXON_ID=265536 /ORGANISM="Amphiprora sp., Strain CCMP467" /LENGTH=376 /DNA_ID=CAMNT_0008766587 /DNA_START=90 /DNA_END=1220 /DNA_ORIENTATION=+